MNAAIGVLAALLARAKEYSRENWGAPLIVSFMLLLIVAAAFLLMGFAGFADSAAVYAYYALLVGIVLRLVHVVKYYESDETEQ